MHSGGAGGYMEVRSTHRLLVSSLFSLEDDFIQMAIVRSIYEVFYAPLLHLLLFAIADLANEVHKVQLVTLAIEPAALFQNTSIHPADPLRDLTF